MGDILLTSLTENPAETYLGTTWELLPDNKFLKTGTTPLQQNGNNSIKIAKENLPAEKLQVESHSHTQPVHGHKISLSYHYPGSTSCISAYDMGTGGDNLTQHGSNSYYSQSAGGENTGNSSPYTTNMGSGTPITINPEHITIKAWKRTK